MTDDRSELPELLHIIFGRWRSQIIYVGVKLGIFDILGDGASDSYEVSRALGLDAEKTRRLLNALASLSVLQKTADRFSISPRGQFLRAEHQSSIRSLVLLEEGATHYEVWKHLENVVRGLSRTGFEGAFGKSIWDYLKVDSDYARLFHEAMSSYSTTETEAIVATLDLGNLPTGARICDVGGGDGKLLQGIMERYSSAQGILFDLPETIETAHTRTNGEKENRLVRTGGDMFVEVPEADVYFLKHVLHDWNDDECRQILSTIKRNARSKARLVICELILPEEPTASFSTLMDIQMMCVCTGRQRSFSEWSELVRSTGWQNAEHSIVPGSPLQIVYCR